MISRSGVRRGMAIAAGLLAMAWLECRLIDWAGPALCTDGRIEPFTMFQLSVNGIVLVGLAAMGWRKRVWRLPILARIPRAGWIAAACGIVPAGLYLGSCRMASWRPWFEENGGLEMTTPALALAAFGLFAWNSIRRVNAPRPDRAAALAYAMLAAGSFLLAMEELDWGQVIVGWKAPETLFARNVQDATNLHNFFNAGFPYLYEVAGWVLGVAAVVSGLRTQRKCPRSGWGVVLPPVQLAGLVALAFLFRFWHEVFEQQVGWMMVLHAWLDVAERGLGPEGSSRG